MSDLVERLIEARDRLKPMTHYAGGEFCPVRNALDAMADAANAITAEKAARKDLSLLAAEEVDRSILLRSLLVRAREYVTDSLEAHEHSDGRDLLKEIDAAVALKCANHPDRPTYTNLDGEELCRECADAWVRAEGQWQQDEEARTQ